MIRLNGVEKVFDMEGARITALTDISLNIEQGEYVALLGPSGSGKSTLLHLIGCLDRPTSGTIVLGDRDVGALSLDQLAAIRSREIGFVFQAFHLMPRLTALENVALPMRFAGVPRSERARRATELLGLVDLEHRLRHRPAELSGGEQQRVAIARALANDPSLLLADEPTGNLDSRTGDGVLSILERLHEHGRTLIVVTHDGSLAKRARRTIRLLDGRLVG